MTCQCCGTVDNKNGRGPVKVYSFVEEGEGLCKICAPWAMDFHLRRVREITDRLLYFPFTHQ